MNEQRVFHVIGGAFDECLERELQNKPDIRVGEVHAIPVTLTSKIVMKYVECIDWFQVGDSLRMYTVYLFRTL